MNNNPNTEFAPLQKDDNSITKRPLVLGLFVASCLLLMGVVFVLPGVIENSQQDLEKQSAAETAVAPSTAPSTESPWQDAQLARERRLAQDLLSELLQAQEQLQAQQVETWGLERYQSALALAQGADESYRQRQYEKAQSSYRQALDIFTEQLGSIDQIYQQLIEEGKVALTEKNSEQAGQLFQTASQLDTSDPANQDAALALYAKAQVADEVNDLLNKGERFQRQSQWQSALKIYQQAGQLDPSSDDVNHAIETAQKAIADQQFNTVMSSGYETLEAGQYSKAQSHFKQALTLEPTSEAAKAGLGQARDGAKQTRLENLLQEADTATTNERWEQAQKLYRQALSLDVAEVRAKIGGIQAQARLNLDRDINALLKSPAQLQDPVVLQRGKTLLAQARQIKQNSQRLQQQIVALDEQVSIAGTPHTVELRSDGFTDVKLLKHSRLGSFQAQRLELVPGQYVAVGSRAGFRDVRLPFKVSANKNIQIVEVACREKI